MLRGSCFLLLLLPILACRTTADGSDRFPPDMTFRYRKGDALWVELSLHGERISIGRDEMLTVWVNAHDPGGVKEVRVDASGDRRCSTGGGGGPGSPGSTEVETVSFSKVAAASARRGGRLVDDLHPERLHAHRLLDPV